MASVSESDDDAITGINVTPLVDVTLVLLIAFMVTASFIVAPAIKVELPKATTAAAAPPTTLSLVLTREGSMYLNNAPVHEDDVRRFIRDTRAAEKELQAMIAADSSVTHGRVVALIDLVRSEGVENFAINTDTQFSDSAPAKIAKDGKGR